MCMVCLKCTYICACIWLTGCKTPTYLLCMHGVFNKRRHHCVCMVCLKCTYICTHGLFNKCRHHWVCMVCLSTLKMPHGQPTLSVGATLQASLSSTFLQTLPDLVMSLKGHSLSLHSCPAMRSVPSERFRY